LVSFDSPFGIFWFPLWYLLIPPLVFSDYSFDIFWLPLWYLLKGLSVDSKVGIRRCQRSNQKIPKG
jgi:hypothetical protein